MSSSPIKIVGSYELGRTLGKGTYSTVKRAYHVVTREEVAIKIMTLGAGKCDLEDIEREIAILKLLKHPNIIQLLDVINEQENNKIYLVFELVNGGDLFDYTIARGRLTEREARRIMREVVSAVAYCHAHMVVHRDIKLENLLMDKDGHARIADFGMSALMQTGLKMKTFCGSPMYMSPEIVQGLGYGSGVDIWSLGVVLYAIVVGCTPWRINKAKEMVEDLDAMLRGDYTYPEDVKLSTECKELISLMIVPEHAKRASIEQIMEHPWLSEGGQPVTVPMNVSPVSEVNEVVLRNMLAMGYSEPQVRKSLSDVTSSPSPARAVYQHMIHQMEEGFEPLVPASPRKHTRHASTSSAGSSPRTISPRSASTSPRRQILLDGRARASSDASRRRKSLELASSPLSITAPVSPRAALTSSWRQSQMSTIREENHASAEGGQSSKPERSEKAISKSSLPSLALPTFSHHMQQYQVNHNTLTPTLTASGSITPPSPTPCRKPPFTYASAPTSPSTSPRVIAWSDELPLVAVRGAFNVQTTTLKPRRSLIAEIARSLESAGIASTLSRSIFSCKVASPMSTHKSPPKHETVHDEDAANSDHSDNDHSEVSESDEKDSEEKDSEEKYSEEKDSDDEDKLKFEVEVCRVAGMEMLLGVRFQRVTGDKDEYQDICKKLITRMKL